MKRIRIGRLALVFALGIGCASAAELDDIRRLADDGNTVAALERLDERLGKDPNDVQALFLKGTLLLDMGRNAAARDTFSDMTRRFPRLPEGYNNLAVAYAADGDYEKARQALLAAAANAPDLPAVQVNLGDLYVKLAADAYRKALDMNPADEASKSRLLALEALFQTRK